MNSDGSGRCKLTTAVVFELTSVFTLPLIPLFVNISYICHNYRTSCISRIWRNFYAYDTIEEQIRW